MASKELDATTLHTAGKKLHGARLPMSVIETTAFSWAAADELINSENYQARL